MTEYTIHTAYKLMTELIPDWSPLRREGWTTIGHFPNSIPMPEPYHPVIDQPMIEVQDEGPEHCSIYVLLAMREGEDGYWNARRNNVVVGVYKTKEKAEQIQQLLETYNDSNYTSFILQEHHLQ
jgi:hypothetical protein